ncbi:nucleotidyltransferase domain-containing protein [Thermoanaerobacterium thermosaccharolyticum]|uniref:nucleotidyltransferase domain-containing protein n=2 Tax=Thermoanaerobacterium thermosaccharolyticum TaxID=1517 RepID=UPI003DA7E7D4
MNIQNKDELEIIKNLILSNIDADKIYLFGSYAYGTPSEESDYDILVIIPDNSIRPVEAMQLLGNLLYKVQTKPVDLIVSKSSDFNNRSRLPTLERKIARDGVILYEKNRHSKLSVKFS